MNKMYDVIVIGGGPAGLATTSVCREKGLSTLLIEREDRLGGILKQCIHDGFGLTRYQKRLTGTEYAYKDIKRINELGAEILTSTFVLDIDKKDNCFYLTVTNKSGVNYLTSKTIVFATGCRERTAKQILIHGSRPSGVYTAGCVQNLVNIHGLLPGKNVVILGSGDIGLIMARRLTLEGAKVIGVYEVKPTPSGLTRNIVQCLNDFNIPLHLSKTVTRVFGKDRIEAVEIMNVDENLNLIPNTAQTIKCDTLVLSVGLIPENELANKLNIQMSPFTKGALVDNNLMTSISGVFMVGNCLSVNDLVDYVSENGFIAANGIVDYLKKASSVKLVDVKQSDDLLTIVPQKINLNSKLSEVIFYLRSKKDYKNKKLIIKDANREYFAKTYPIIHSSESIRVVVNLEGLSGQLEVELV